MFSFETPPSLLSPNGGLIHIRVAMPAGHLNTGCSLASVFYGGLAMNIGCLIVFVVCCLLFLVCVFFNASLSLVVGMLALKAVVKSSKTLQTTSQHGTKWLLI